MLDWKRDGDDLVAVTNLGTYTIVGPDDLMPTLIYPDGEGASARTLERAKEMAAEDYQEKAR